MRRVLIPLFTMLALALPAQGALAQSVAASPTVEQNPAVDVSAHNDASPPLRTIPPAQPLHQVAVARPVRPVPHAATGGETGAVQPAFGYQFMPATSANFDGIGNGIAGFRDEYAPPDTNGAAGLSVYVQIVNADFAVYNKSTGALVYGPVPINTLWSGFGGGCETNDDGDPTVVYDRMADRWIISQMSVSTTPYLQCVAVSQTGDPTGSYYRYAFQYAFFPDYPKLSVWPDAYYQTFNSFGTDGNTWTGGEVCAYDRTAMLAGRAARQQCFNVGTSYGGLLAASLDGPTPPPAGSPDYVLSLGASDGQLAFWKFHVDWANSANTKLTGPTILTTAPFSLPCGDTGGVCVWQPGTMQQLDTLGDRLMYRLAYRNFGDHESLVVNHTVAVGSTMGIRWYELRNPSTTPYIYQQGTYAPDSNARWMGSIAMDHVGDIALGFSISSFFMRPSIHYTGRLVSDPLGQMTQGEGTIINGTGSQINNLSRWGDYSGMSVDPSDDCTFWYTNEYLPSNGSFNWRTRIASFRFPSCASSSSPSDFSISANPSSVSIAQGAGGGSTINTGVTSGSAGTVNLSASVSPSGPTVSLNSPSVTAGGSDPLTINVGSSVAPGPYTVTVTGTEGSVTHTTTVNVTVTSPATNDFSISAGSPSLTIAQGASGTSQINTAVASGSAGTVSLSADVSPSGPTAGVSPTPITAGGSSTLTVNVGSSVPPGPYTVTVTGTEGSVSHSTTVSVTVTAAATGGVVNGGFETGDFTGWTRTGATSISTSAHSGSYSAMVGSTYPSYSDSSISQTFTIPNGVSTLSFYYQAHCFSNIYFSWATVMLKDNTTGLTSIPLARTCTNNYTWVHVTATVVAGHSVTLTLMSHSAYYYGGPNYTLYDDVTLS